MSTIVDSVLPTVMRDEGFRAKPYPDENGHLTIGYGTNLDQGLDDDEAMFLLQHRLDKSFFACRTAFPWFGQLTDARQGVLVQMTYQLGLGGVLDFHDMRRALERGDAAAAADAMLDSKWAREDAPARAHRLANVMRSGKK